MPVCFSAKPQLPTFPLCLPCSSRYKHLVRPAHEAKQAYNSIFNALPQDSSPILASIPLLPLRTKTRGPAYVLPQVVNPPLPPSESPDPESESYDILDETLALFRANTFFRNFEIQGPADRLLMYGIWFVSDCLGKIRPGHDARAAGKEVMNLALDLNFAIPGDPGWPLNQVCSFFWLCRQRCQVTRKARPLSLHA